MGIVHVDPRRSELEAENERLRAERDALLGLLIHEVEGDGWVVIELPDTLRTIFRDRASAVAALRRAARRAAGLNAESPT